MAKKRYYVEKIPYGSLGTRELYYYEVVDRKTDEPPEGRRDCEIMCKALNEAHLRGDKKKG